MWPRRCANSTQVAINVNSHHNSRYPFDDSAPYVVAAVAEKVPAVRGEPARQTDEVRPRLCAARSCNQTGKYKCRCKSAVHYSAYGTGTIECREGGNNNRSLKPGCQCFKIRGHIMSRTCISSALSPSALPQLCHIESFTRQHREGLSAGEGLTA